jgi:5-methylcytosine-specific restriction endonuclease McrA
MEDKNILIDLHYNKKLSSIEIAKYYNVNSRTIRNWFYKYNIKMIGNTFQKGKPNPKNSIKTEKQLALFRVINIGREPYNKGVGHIVSVCKYCNASFSDKPYRRKSYCSKKCRGSMSGENHQNYQGKESRGIQTRRSWDVYKKLRKAVIIRDNCKCVLCEDKGTQMHHIESWSNNENIRFEASNCILVCTKCHREIHKLCGQRKYDSNKFKSLYFNNETNTWKKSALTTW